MRSIIYNDINDSTFYLDIGKVRLFFSSEFNKRRFSERYRTYILEETKKLEKKYNVKIVANYYLMFAFYKKIEKRGFRVENNVTGALVSINCTFLVEL